MPPVGNTLELLLNNNASGSVAQGQRAFDFKSHQVLGAEHTFPKVVWFF